MRRTSLQQLPIWAEPVRGAPNALLRSSFFAGIHSKKRKVLGTQPTPQEAPEGVIIAAVKGVTIKYAGVQLNQYDADVFFEALHLARRDMLGTECCFKGHAFLKAIGRSDSTPNYKDLDQSLRRLRHGTVDVEFRLKGRPIVFTGSLISHYARDTESKLYKIAFSKEIAALFAPAAWTALEADERRALKGKPLAQWLHSFYSTHAEALPVSVEFLKGKTGSPTQLLKHFKTELKAAFAALEEALGWTTEWNGDLVTVTKPPSEAQARHIERKETQRKRDAAAYMKGKAEDKKIRGLTNVGTILSDLFTEAERRRR